MIKPHEQHTRHCHYCTTINITILSITITISLAVVQYMVGAQSY